MERTLVTEPQRGQQENFAQVIFTVDLGLSKVVRVTPVVDSDESLSQLNHWVDACVVLANLIHPPKQAVEKAAA